MADEEHKLHRQMNAAAALKHSLKETLGDDDETMRDMIEGETSLHEMIERVVMSMDEDGMLVTGLASRIEELTQRKKRIEDRIGSKRAMVEQAMLIGEIDKLERPSFTLSLRKVPPKAEIAEESLIPAAYWVAQPPKLDKKALLSALKDGAQIPGATIGNGGIALQIRTK